MTMIELYFYTAGSHIYISMITNILQSKGYFYGYTGEKNRHINHNRPMEDMRYITVNTSTGNYYGSRSCHPNSSYLFAENDRISYHDLMIMIPNFNQPTKEESTMNKLNESTLIVTLNPEQFQFVNVIPNNSLSEKSYTYKAPKGLYEIGDIVLVSFGDKTLLATVVDTNVKLSSIKADLFYKWILTKIDLSAVHEIQAKEQEMLDTIKEAMFINQQKQIIDGVLSQTGLNIQDIFAPKNAFLHTAFMD